MLEANTPCKVSVQWIDGQACFNIWYAQQTLNTEHHGTTVIVECCFVRKVYIILILLVHNMFLS